MQRVSTGRRLAAFVAIGAVVGVLPFADAATAGTRMGHGGGAYGTSIKLGSVFTSGPSALATLGCTNQAGITNTNSALSGGLLAAGTVGVATVTVHEKPCDPPFFLRRPSAMIRE